MPQPDNNSLCIQAIGDLCSTLTKLSTKHRPTFWHMGCVENMQRNWFSFKRCVQVALNYRWFGYCWRNKVNIHSEKVHFLHHFFTYFWRNLSIWFRILYGYLSSTIQSMIYQFKVWIYPVHSICNSICSLTGSKHIFIWQDLSKYQFLNA